MRVAIAHSEPMILQLLQDHVSQETAFSLSWSATTAEAAARQCLADHPDLLLLALHLSDLSGAEATRKIMAEAPCPILIICEGGQGYSAHAPYEALAAGALDAVAVPMSDIGMGVTQLRRKLGQLALILPKPATAAHAPAGHHAPTMLAIGASTGGPAVIAGLLRELRAPMAASCIIVQHINPEFAPGMAHWLGVETGHRVSLAVGGEKPAPGIVYLGGGPGHLTLSADNRLVYRREPADYPYQPSIDECFESLRHWPRPAVALLLTGMGRDGVRGLGILREHGWTTIAQTPASCAVKGMPQAAIDAGAARHVLDPEQMAHHLRDVLEKAVPR